MLLCSQSWKLEAGAGELVADVAKLLGDPPLHHHHGSIIHPSRYRPMTALKSVVVVWRLNFFAHNGLCKSIYSSLRSNHTTLVQFVECSKLCVCDTLLVFSTYLISMSTDTNG